RLIEDGRQRLVLNQPLPLPFPVRLFQGTADTDVPMQWALDLLAHVRGDDVRLTLVKGADHRFSTPECLEMVTQAIEALPMV
ncbi:MAG: alpha/beta hydrolase, partial [Alphaproteobacteria bacterium]|nr:alpha/beta hydrolase [Alphaproteobacteria bacterium]